MRVCLDIIKKERILSTVSIIIKTLCKTVLYCLNYNLKVWWVLVGLFLLSLLVFLFLKNRKKEANDTIPTFVDYSDDWIKGGHWRWRWEKNIYGKYSIMDLHPVCATCETPLVQDDRSYYLICPRCGKRSNTDLPKLDHIELLIVDNVKRKYTQMESSKRDK